jgi:hypothetical protein
VVWCLGQAANGTLWSVSFTEKNIATKTSKSEPKSGNHIIAVLARAPESSIESILFHLGVWGTDVTGSQFSKQFQWSWEFQVPLARGKSCGRMISYITRVPQF